jgi:hypothetical protein
VAHRELAHGLIVLLDAAVTDLPSSRTATRAIIFKPAESAEIPAEWLASSSKTSALKYFAALLTRCVDTDASPPLDPEQLHVEDLYLACAYGLGLATAQSHIATQHFARIKRRLDRMKERTVLPVRERDPGLRLNAQPPPPSEMD